MFFVRDIGKSSHGLVLNRAVIMCVAAVGILLARTTPPSFPHLKLTVNSQADHGHRQCFDHEDSQWVGPPPSTAQATPPPVVSSHLTYASEPFVEIATEGLHYNRPPPLS